MKLSEKEVKKHLRNLLIAFAQVKPTYEDYENVNAASLFLQKIDPDWRRVCQESKL